MNSKLSLFALLIIIFSLSNCQKKSDSAENLKIQSYKEIDQIEVEQFDSANTDDSRYNYDNVIFTEGKSFTYRLLHLSKDGDSLSFIVPEREQMYQALWHFTALENDSAVETVKIKVTEGRGFMGRQYPDYYQTVVKYEYFTKTAKLDYNSISGVIENEKNLWAHPPRDYYFQMLELNPFPYVKFPLKKGNRWEWSLTIGSRWGDERWKTWEGNIENSFQYEIIGKEKIKTAFGEIECTVIEAQAKSELGSTSLRSYFHPEYGFILLDYTNIDSSKTLLQLTEIE